MTNPNPDVMAMARRIAADGYYPIRDGQMIVPYGRERILSGDMDHTVQVQTCLLALLETTERAAKMADDEAPSRPDDDHQLGWYEAVTGIATALRQFAHLKGPSHD